MSEKAAALFGALAYIDDDIIESALSATPESVVTARVTPFTKRPWMKWVAAVAIVVFAAGTPIALNMMGAFRNDNIVAPAPNSGVGSEDDDPGFTTPIESSDPESSSEYSSEDASGSSEGEKPVHSDSSERSGKPSTQRYSSEHSSESESAPGSSEQEPESGSSETPDEPGTGGGTGRPDSDGPTSGEFIKDNMPPITFRIAGESKTFSYSISEWVTTHWQSFDACYSIDHYVGSDGSSILINSETGKLIQYERTVLHGDSPVSIISENEAIETAKQAVLNTDIALSGFENAEVSVQTSAKGYYVTLTVPEGKVYVSVDKQGSLLGIYAALDLFRE